MFYSFFQNLCSVNANTDEATQELKEWRHVIDMQKRLKDIFRAAQTNRSSQIEFGTLLSKYVTYYTNKNRKAATKILIIMISEETRTVKPYSWVVQAIPYRSLSNMDVEKMMDKVREEVLQNGGNVTARVSDGEHNSLRFMGKERPRCVLKVGPRRKQFHAEKT